MTGLSPAKFASAVGMQVDAVYKAVADGRLGAAAKRHGRRISIDLELGREAMKGWRRADEPSPPPRAASGDVRELGETYQGEGLEESAAVEKFWKAKLAELQFKKTSGELIEVGEMQRLYATEVASCRTKILAVVPRLRQRVTLTEPQWALFEDLIREALEELGRSSSGETAEEEED
jgi:hypothetical protein